MWTVSLSTFQSTVSKDYCSAVEKLRIQKCSDYYAEPYLTSAGSAHLEKQFFWLFLGIFLNH